MTALLNGPIHYFLYSLYEIQTTPHSDLFHNSSVSALLEKDEKVVVLFKNGVLKHLK